MSVSLFEFGEQRLNELIKPGMLCAFDFDGTLAPLSNQPGQVRLPSPVARRLRTLSTYVPVAIITGRSVDDVRTRLGFEPDFVVGNHGIEGVPGWEEVALQYLHCCEQWWQGLNAVFRATACIDSNIWIENKRYSLSVHYRMAQDRALAETLLPQVFEEVMPEAHVTGGKCVFNLLPEGAPNKGSALARLCEVSRAESALYVGDDVTDEDVFNQKRANWLTLRVERNEHSAAEFHLYHRLDMIKLIDEVIARLSGFRH
jgi:trehalose 6-phosphate phosphatase